MMTVAVLGAITSVSAVVTDMLPCGTRANHSLLVDVSSRDALLAPEGTPDDHR